jgi:hypothetical protein
LPSSLICGGKKIGLAAEIVKKRGSIAASDCSTESPTVPFPLNRIHNQKKAEITTASDRCSVFTLRCASAACPNEKILSTAGLIRLRKDNACNHFERLLSEARHAFKSLKIEANKNYPACFAYADGKIKGSGDVDKKHK